MLRNTDGFGGQDPGIRVSEGRAAHTLSMGHVYVVCMYAYTLLGLMVGGDG